MKQFRNILIYATRISSSSGFRLHGVLRTSQLQLQTDCITGIPHSITIMVQEEVEKMLILSAFSQESKAEWTTALEDAISSNTSIHITTNNNWTSSEEFEPPPIIPSITTPPLSRSNLTTHVCWHRNLSISNEFILSQFPKSMSSYLLRKFKSSPGWQRLWVVYSNLVLYFHKCHDSLEPPLASLPLLGYSVETTDKPHTFKLSFKNHVYYFKAESPHVSEEWVGLLGGVSGK
jgi:FERM/RhoGEF/pleckstrin domain protein 2